jgi:acyl-CoA dehydrogenase
VEARIRGAVRAGRIDYQPGDALARAAAAAGVIDERDLAQLASAERAREEAIAVDAFAPEEYARVQR